MNCVQGTFIQQYIQIHKFSLKLCTGRSLTECDDTRCCIYKIRPPDEEHDIARNMQMTVINVL